MLFNNINIIVVSLLLRTNGVNTNGAAAKVINVDRLGNKVRPSTLGKTRVGFREYPKSLSVENTSIAVTQSILTPVVPFRSLHRAPKGGVRNTGTLE